MENIFLLKKEEQKKEKIIMIGNKWLGEKKIIKIKEGNKYISDYINTDLFRIYKNDQ